MAFSTTPCGEPLSATTGSPTTPLAFVRPLRQRHPRLLAENSGKDFEEWLSFYNRVSLHYQLEPATKLANVILYLADVSRTWYLNHEKEMTTWDAFAARVQGIFGRPQDRKADSLQKLTVRFQVPNESYTAHIEDVISLCHQADVSMPEANPANHVLKGIREKAFGLFADSSQRYGYTVPLSSVRRGP